MKKKLLFTMLIIPFSIMAQNNPEWVDTVSYNADYFALNFEDMTIDKAGNVYTVGSKFDSNNASLILVKYNSSGIRQFLIDTIINQIGGYIYMAVDDSMNVYITSTLFSNSTFNDVFLIKYDSAGNPLWSQTYSSGSGQSEDWPHAIALNDGYVYITGTSDTLGGNEFFTMKYNPSGNLQWVTKYHYYYYSDSYAIDFDGNHNVYVTGRSLDTLTNYDIATVKYNSAGVQQWVKRFNSTDNDIPLLIKVSPNGNCFIGGFHSTAGGGDNYYLTLRYDSTGNLIWSSIFDPGNGSGGEHWISDIAIDDSENVYVTGTQFFNSTTDQNFYTMKYDSSGNILWQQQYNGSNMGEVATSISIDKFHNCYVSGSCYSDFSDRIKAIKYDTNGNLIWVAEHSLCPSCGHNLTESECDSSGSLYISGILMGPPNFTGIETLKYDNLVDVKENINPFVIGTNIYPNPASQNIFISFSSEIKNAHYEIYDLTGKKVDAGKIFSQKQNISLRNFHSGIYLVRISDGGKIYTKKFVVEK